MTIVADILKIVCMISFLILLFKRKKA